LKGVTAPIHGIQLGKVGMWAAVVTPLDPVGRNTGVAHLFCFLFCHAWLCSLEHENLGKQIQLQFSLFNILGDGLDKCILGDTHFNIAVQGPHGKGF